MTTTATDTRPRSAWAEYGEWWKRTPGSALYLLVVFVAGDHGAGRADHAALDGRGAHHPGGRPADPRALAARRARVRRRRPLAAAAHRASRDRRARRGTGQARHDGFWMTLTRPLRNGHYWVYLLHGMIVSPIISIVTFTLTTVWLSVGLGGLTYWFWGVVPAQRRRRR